MKNYNTAEENLSGITTNSTGQPPAFLKNISSTGPGLLCTKTAIILKLYGMSLVMDETAGELLIANSILKNVAMGKFIRVIDNKDELAGIV